MSSGYLAAAETGELFYEQVIGEEGGSGDEMDEVIEVLGVIIPEIRYLSPRTPIPRSVYLFTHLVSKYFLLVL